jgi:putative oxidoreductase
VSRLGIGAGEGHTFQYGIKYSRNDRIIIRSEWAHLPGDINPAEGNRAMIDTRTAPYATLALRVTLGILFLAHDGLKFFVFTPAGTAKYFASLGLPSALAYATMLVELVAGVGLILGIWTRLTALVGISTLLGAIISVHAANGFFFNNPGGGWEFPAFWIVALVVQALLGDGAFALKPTPTFALTLGGRKTRHGLSI